MQQVLMQLEGNTLEKGNEAEAGRSSPAGGSALFLLGTLSTMHAFVETFLLNVTKKLKFHATKSLPREYQSQQAQDSLSSSEPIRKRVCRRHAF